ncbi:MAG: imidazoleglycerol-phosphate dehydratase HisB [Desulfobulbus sp.]|nr:MAG: imidazoleglycerol-phosphate dehydratase HisB [Desulfobulbus sp.]RUM35691.1 MAG: imidazoleglycerol-phosphate dehydratase HisB [Desulfobulbus sp.]
MAETPPRRSEIERKTRETAIRVTLDLDGSGKSAISTGVGFMDHMLTLFAVHGFFDLQIEASGDTHIDDHHTVEDIGICLGQAFAQALADKSGINRYGHAYVPMDETLARTCVDFSNRPYLHYNVSIQDQKVGTFDTALASEFLRALSLNAGLTLHVDLLHGENAHHIIEAVFKSLGRALGQASAPLAGLAGTLSSKGSL